MPTQSLLEIVGSKSKKQTRYAPIFTDRFFVGYWTNRNPLRSPLSTFYADGWHLGGTDALIDGQNVELSPRLTPCRRPGNIAYSTQTIPTPPLTFYPFELFGATPTIDLMVDTTAEIYQLTPTARTSIFAKAANAGQTNFMGIGQTLYFGDGAEVKAWQNGTIRNWGISIGPFSNSVGPNTAGTGADGGGSVAWSNPSDITGSIGFATATVSLPSISGVITFYTNDLLATNFSFSLPVQDTITGIEVTCTGLFTLNSGSAGNETFWAQLLKNGSPVGNPISVPAPSSSGTLTFGGPSNLWGTTFSPNDANQTAFGVQIYASATTVPHATGNVTFSVQNAQMTISGTGGPTVTATGTGVLTGTYTYVVAYGNSASGHVSSTTPPSSPVSPSSQQVQVTLVASTDPQVNQIWVFRIANGGSTYLNLPTSPYPNTSANILDNSPDADLEIEEQAPINGANNPPPSAALDPVQYLGLPWIHVGNTVYYGRSPSAIVGSQWESFPPANSFTFPEQVIRKVPWNGGLLIFTTANIYTILGNNTSSSPLYSAPFLNGYGIVSWNALTINGSTIYFFTSDHRMLSLNPSSGIEDMGFPIGDQLATLNPANVYVTYYSNTSNDVALYLTDGSTKWFRCNPNQAPDGQITGPVWSPPAVITGGLGALVSLQTSPGSPALLMGGTGNNESVLFRDSTYSTFSDNGSAYASHGTIGSIVLAQPGQAAICRFITYDAIRTGTAPIISVLLDEISGSFTNISGYVVNDPPYLSASTSLFNNRFYFKQSIGGAAPPPALCRHMQIKFDYGATDTVQNELLSLTVNGAIYQEK